LRVLGREEQWEERVVLTFEAEDTVVARGFDARRGGRYGVEVGGSERGVDLHASSLARLFDGGRSRIVLRWRHGRIRARTLRRARRRRLRRVVRRGRSGR